MLMFEGHFWVFSHYQSSCISFCSISVAILKNTFLILTLLSMNTNHGEALSGPGCRCYQTGLSFTGWSSVWAAHFQPLCLHSRVFLDDGEGPFHFVAWVTLSYLCSVHLQVTATSRNMSLKQVLENLEYLIPSSQCLSCLLMQQT